jgi:4-carboxymuconolactone decarboxylase
MSNRIQPSTPEQWSEESREILAGATPAAEHSEGTGPPNILYTIAHHPTLLRPFLGFTAALAMRGVLKRRDSELLALRTSWNCRSPFEWGHHVEYGLAEGLSHSEIEQIRVGPSDPGWKQSDRLLLQAADQLHASQALGDEVFAGLRANWSEAEIVEIVFVVGNYTMLSMVANSTGVPLESRLPEMPPG